MSSLSHAREASWREWIGPSFVAVSALLGVLVAIVLAIPTAIIENPFFTRMTPVEPEQYVFWVATSALTGILLATYMHPALRSGLAGQSAGGGLLGLFAVGCPVCNKLVVGVLGTSGALTYFAPIQPILGLAAIGLVVYGIRARLRLLRTASCPVPRAR
jgi:cbb3-type cytochrome oxidase subunit 1